MKIHGCFFHPLSFIFYPLIKTVVPLLLTLFAASYNLHAGLLDETGLSFTRIDTTFYAEPYPIASPLKGGPLRILFIGRHDCVGKSGVEVSARLESRIESVLTGSRSSPGAESPLKERQPAVLTENGITKRMLRLLGEKWDVIWLDFDIDSLPGEAEQILFDNIGRGTGLVYVGERGELRPFADRGKVDRKPLDAASFSGIKPEFGGRRDRGLMVVLPPSDKYNDVLSIGDYYSCAVNALIFASGRRTGTTITQIKQPKKIELEAMDYMNYRVDFFHDGETEPMKVHCRFRNEKGEVAFESAEIYNINKDKSFIQLEYPLLPVGKYSLDISVSDDEGVAAVAGTSFIVRAEQRIAEIKLLSPYSQEGGVIAGSVKLSSEFEEGTRLYAELLDSYGRLYGKSELEVIPQRISAPFSFLVKGAQGNVMYVRIYFYRNRRHVHTFETPVFIKRPHDPEKFNFIVNVDNFSVPENAQRYKILGEAGVNVFAPDFSDIPGQEEAFNRVVEASLYGINVIPSFEYLPSLNGKKISRNEAVLKKRLKAVIDTLRYLELPAYSINPSAGDTIKARVSGGNTIKCLLVGGESYRRWEKPLLRAAPWQSLFSGMDGIWWGVERSRAEAALTPYLAPSPAFSIVAGEVREITDGIDRLLYGSTMEMGLYGNKRLNGGETGEQYAAIVNNDGNRIYSVNLAVYRDGESVYIGALTESGSGIVNIADGNGVLKIKSPDIPRCVYDIRSGTFIGVTADIPVSLLPGQAQLFALLPYRVMKVDLSLKKSVVKTGEKLEYSVNIIPQNTTTVTGRHVVQVSVTGPDGVDCSYFSDTFNAVKGSFEGVLPIARNEKHGRWVIKVRDVATGRQTERTFMVMATGRELF